jgi:hypothetical protein
MERNMISWNLPNIITIGLMAMATWGAVFLGAQFLQRAGFTSGGNDGQ